MDDFLAFVDRATKLLDDVAELTIRQGSRLDFSGPTSNAADAFVTSLGYSPLGAGWFDLADHGPEPLSHLADTLKRDLIWLDLVWLNPEDATACAEQFYSLFCHGEVHRLANRIRNGWNPITSSTIEAAFVAMDDLRIGLFLVEAED